MANRVLLVEDEPIIASSIARRLRQLGYEVLGSASSGDVAIRLIDQGQPDLVLMDIKIEGRMDGIETAGEIRRRFDIPVVFLTAYADEATIARAKLQDPFGYIVKPFTDRELSGAVEIALHRSAFERTIRRSEERYRMLSSVLSDYAFIIAVAPDAENDVLEWSVGSIAAVFGEAVATFSSVDAVAHLAHPDDVASLLDCWRDLRGGGQGRVEFRTLRGDGTERWMKLDGRSMKSRDGGLRIYGSFQDISALRSLEKRLGERELEFSRIVQLVRQGIWVADRDHLCMFANQAVCDMTGFAREELVGKQTLEALLSGDLPDERADEPFETEIVTRSGAHLPVLITPRSVSAEGAESRGGFYLIVDISRQRRTAELLERGRRKLSEVFHASPAPSLLIDAATNAVVDVNHAFTDVTGFRADEIVGTGGFGLAEYHDLEDLNRMVMILKERSGRNTVRLKTTGGATRLFSIDVRTIVVDDDELLMLILEQPTRPEEPLRPEEPRPL